MFAITPARLLLSLAVVCAVVVAFFISPRETLSQTSTPITGFAWSETIGWVSLNCVDLGTCATSNYGLSIAADGTISGYAWSENIGWISANGSDLSGCPAAPCTARMQDYSLKGWLKALSGNDAQSGGWDGFISLSGSNYGPTLSNGVFSGYAWGGDINVGWISFNSTYHQAETEWEPQCASQYQCVSTTTRQNACENAEPEACLGGLLCASGACVPPPPPTTSFGGELTVEPRLISVGGVVSVSWNVNDAEVCEVKEDNPLINDTWSGNSGSYTSSPIRRQTTYTLTCSNAGGELVQTATVYNNPTFEER